MIIEATILKRVKLDGGNEIVTGERSHFGGHVLNSRKTLG